MRLAVFPAGAGVILFFFKSDISTLSFPRRCGGDPSFFAFVSVYWLFSPQVRGWSWFLKNLDVRYGVFPAGAGVIPSIQWNRLCRTGFPRRCGGDPIDSKKAELEELFSPQVRGWSHLRVILTLCGAVFPAGAGVIPLIHAVQGENGCFPRRCGGDPPTDEIYVIDRASSRNNRGEPCLWHSHKSIRFFQKIRLLFQDISEWCN